MIPGGDLLALALTVLGSTSVNYFKFSNRETNIGGVDVSYYFPAKTICEGSVQPINKNRYTEFGLDFEKSYITWYVNKLDAHDLSRDISGDVIEVNRRRWQLIGSVDWLDADGWKTMVAVDIGPATGALTNA